MILTGKAIAENVAIGKIDIHPFYPEHVNPNSYDVLLGEKLMVYTDSVLDTAKSNAYEEILIPNEGLVLKKNHFYLGHTLNRIGSDHFVPVIHCKSGIARLGLFIHITADLIDIGFHGNLTLQLFPTHDIKVYPGMKIAQVSFWAVQGPIKLYTGKYQDALGPLTSKSFKDHSKPILVSNLFN